MENVFGIDAVVMLIRKFKYFITFGWKTPIHAPEMGGLSIQPPKW